MKKLLLIIGVILLSITPSLIAQHITLEEQVSIHNSKYETGTIQYVQNAFATAPFSGSDETDIDGKFGLTFVGMDAGTEVKVSVEKADLDLVNIYHLQQVIIGRKTLLRVYLTEKGKLAIAQLELFNISKKALFAQKDALIARLQGSEKQKKAALQELESKLGIEIADKATAIELLDSKIENLEKRLPEFAQKMAEVNLDFASDLYISAYEYFKKGEIEKAILVLDDAQLEASYQKAISTIAEGKKLQEIGKDLAKKGLLQVDQIIESYELKAESYSLLFQYRLATEVYEKIIRILKETKGDDTLELADAYNVLGGLYQELGAYQQAFIYQQKNVSIKESLLDSMDTDLATSYHNLASIYQDLGNYEKALQGQQKAHVILAQVYEANHPNIATSYNNLAGIYQGLGDFEKALLAHQKALAIRKQVYDAKHPSIANSYNNLALIYQDLGDYKTIKKLSKLIKKHLPF